ncbi:MAG TPA: hypothetical protein VFK44_02355 [Bacillales bacterium]|nr:hypothetical protein [Bacillales bacterium]
MPMDNYGILKGKVVDKQVGSGISPHYQLHLIWLLVGFLTMRMENYDKERIRPQQNNFCLARRIRVFSGRSSPSSS